MMLAITRIDCLYKCEVTGKQVWPGVSQERVVVEAREKQYFVTDLKGRTRLVGTGTEIVREVTACPFHALSHREGVTDGLNSLPECGVAPPEIKVVAALDDAPVAVAVSSEE